MRESERSPFQEKIMIPYIAPEHASPEQRTIEMKLAGAHEQLEDQILDRWLAEGRARNEASEDLPPENYQPLSEETKARIIADMAKHMEEWAAELAVARMPSPSGSVTAEVWKAAQERQMLRERFGIRAHSHYYWPQNGQPVGSLSAAPPGLLKQDHLVPVLADCRDIPSHLALVRWSPGRPVRGVPFPIEPYLP